MKFQFNGQQLSNMERISDVALKRFGYEGLERVLYIVNIVKNHEDGICEFRNTDMAIIEQIFDAAIKINGLGVAEAILELTNILRNPNPEHEESHTKKEEELINIES